ncbi:MAG: hypothetical protein U9Q05_00980 [Thermodesulfobacteriota bacterium]|nr:hypothetical protein [Thermodesulfobacteriota bacterium]
MSNDHSKNGRLIAVFFLGVLLLTYPILTLFDHSILLFGIPLLFLYLFAVWAGLIGLIGLITRRALRNRPADTGKGR